MKPNPDENRSTRQAEAQLESIRELVAALRASGNEYEVSDEAQQAIYDDPLAVQVRSGWADPGAELRAVEFMILLATGGPAVRLIGDLNEHGEPENVRMEHQDWDTPWTPYGPAKNDEAVMEYVRQFYFVK